MTTFTIDTDNNIIAFATADQVPEGLDPFTTEKGLAKLSAEWPIARFGEVWNAFAGVPPFGDLKPVKKFTDRKTAASRIWKTIQVLGEDLMRASISEAEAKLKATLAVSPSEATVAQRAAPDAPKKAKATKKATADDATSTPREGSKTAIVLGLLRRPDGATLAEIMTTTGWQAHSVRGFISGALGKKMGLKVESSRRQDGERVYQLR